MMVYKGPFVPMKIKRDLVSLLRKDGYKSIAEAIGADHKSIQQNAKMNLPNSTQNFNTEEREPIKDNNATKEEANGSKWWRPFQRK